MLSVIVLNVIMLSLVMLNVVMLSVMVAPGPWGLYHKTFYNRN